MNEIEALRQELDQTKLAYQMAAQVSQFKAGFLGRIAHELRSPLSSLMGLHQLILSDLCESPEEEREFIQEAYQAAQKLMSIMDEIVIVSKIDYGQISLQNTTISLTEILANLQQATFLQAKNYTLQLEVISPNPDVFIFADPQRLLQILITLIDTGITLANQGKICISTETNYSNNFVQLSISLPCFWDFEEPDQMLLESNRLTLESFREFSKKIEMSPQLKQLLCQTLLESMGGKLKLNSTEETTHLLILIPLASDQKIVR